jgi:cytidylate kinase
MEHQTTLPQLLEKAFRHWETTRPGSVQQEASPNRVPGYTIALEREAGTRGKAVAQEVGKLLGWHVYDHELIEHIAREMGLRTALLESIDERRQNAVLDLVESFATAHTKSDWSPLVSEPEYFRHLTATVLALGMHGECLIVGRGAAFILPVATTLRVRLVGPVRERIAALSRNCGISEREAAQRVRTKDRERTDFIHDHFFKDANDPRNYDVVVNACRLSVGQCAAVIAESALCLHADRKERTTAGRA